MQHTIISRDLDYPEIIIEKHVLSWGSYVGPAKEEYISLLVKNILKDEVCVDILFYDEDSKETDYLENYWLNLKDELKLTQYSSIEAYVYLYKVSDEKVKFKIETPNKLDYPLKIYRGEVQEAIKNKSDILKYQPAIVFSQCEANLSK